MLDLNFIFFRSPSWLQLYFYKITNNLISKSKERELAKRKCHEKKKSKSEITLRV